jgi:hypothetical protein
MSCRAILLTSLKPAQIIQSCESDQMLYLTVVRGSHQPHFQLRPAPLCFRR